MSIQKQPKQNIIYYIKKNIGISIFVGVTIVLLGWHCLYFKSTNLTFTNNSTMYVDSVGFVLNNYKYGIVGIAPNSTIKKTIYPDSIRLNNHDVMLGVSIFINGKLFKYCYNYNDLYGGLQAGYRVMLKADSTVQIFEEN